MRNVRVCTCHMVTYREVFRKSVVVKDKLCLDEPEDYGVVHNQDSRCILSEHMHIGLPHGFFAPCGVRVRDILDKAKKHIGTHFPGDSRGQRLSPPKCIRPLCVLDKGN